MMTSPTMISYGTVTHQNELEQILSLQRRNYRDVLNNDEIKNEGFVTVRHSLELLSRLNDECPHIIAKDDERVVGYALCMHSKFKDSIEILKPMFNEIKRFISMELPYIVMGQICIDKSYRGQGLFIGLYNRMQIELQDKYKGVITEVDQENTRSLKAHFKIGFNSIKCYEADGREWQLIKKDWN